MSDAGGREGLGLHWRHADRDERVQVQKGLRRGSDPSGLWGALQQTHGAKGRHLAAHHQGSQIHARPSQAVFCGVLPCEHAAAEETCSGFFQEPARGAGPGAPSPMRQDQSHLHCPPFPALAHLVTHVPAAHRPGLVQASGVRELPRGPAAVLRRGHLRAPAAAREGRRHQKSPQVSERVTLSERSMQHQSLQCQVRVSVKANDAAFFFCYCN
mmetsp:Transcript_41190/g.87627  ORF Transcript_41190/g.87627 Transcript_41190/m.87627 type:complete len:213 (-) Transcript_41190:1083-1721(-)